MITPFQFNTTKSIISEVGALDKIAGLCQQLAITRPIIITDQGIVRCGLLQALHNALGGVESGLTLASYQDVVADPAESVIYQAIAQAQQHQADGVIGFGGGSSMDSAKLVAVLAQSKQSLPDIYGIDQVVGERLPLILIPTTAGTGSEVTPIAIVTTGDTSKAGIVALQLLPDIALLDAKLTVNLPAHVTAATGIDAMVHAIEAYTTKHKKNPYSDLLAKQALHLLSANIESATFTPENIEARQSMLLGACLAGQAFANAPVAAVHALAYPLGGHFHIPHGLSNSLVLPHVMRFNLSHASHLYAELAPFVSSTINCQQSDELISEDLITYLEQLIAKLELPTKLSQLNIKQAQLAMLAADAMLQTRLLVNNPRELTYQDALAIYQQAYGATNS